MRATLILIPLLGLHYILTPFRPEAKSEWEGIYESVAAVCTSFQGLCVALLFCFCNGEVITVIKKKLKDTFNSNHHRNGDLNARRNTAFKLNNSNTTISNTLRSVISSSSNGDIMQHQNNNQQQLIQLHQQPILTAMTNNKNSSNSPSNRSSLITTVTASPILVAATTNLQGVNGSTGTLMSDKEVLSATGSEGAKVNDLNETISTNLEPLNRSRPLNRNSSSSGPCLDRSETVHLLKNENNSGILATSTTKSFSVLT